MSRTSTFLGSTVRPIFVGYSSKQHVLTRTRDHLCLLGRRWTAAALVVLAPWLWSVNSATADEAASLRTLANAARTTLAERIEPPASRLPFLCTVRWTETAPMREYLLRQQAEAIEALVASASAPAEARTVRRLLDKLRRDGHAREADARLADTAPGGAIGLRLAASLGELTAAMNERLAPRGCGTTYIGLLGRTFVPLGTLAGADYQRLVELEAEDPWHPLVLAWLAGVEGEPALQRALSVAQTASGDEAARVQIFALQQLAWLRRQQGRGSDAEQAACEAMRIAEARLRSAGDDLAQPGVEQALRDVAQTGSALALTLEDTGQTTAAFDALLEVASRQRRLIALRAEDVPMQLAMVDTLGRLAVLRDAAGPSAPGSSKAYLQEAVSLYKELEQRTPYAPMLSGWQGLLVTAAGMAGALTLVVGWVLLRLYRRRIAKLMMASARTSTPPPPLPGGAVPPPAAMPVRPRSETIAPAALAAAVLRRAALVQIAAGLAFGVAAAWLLLRANDTGPTPIRLALMSWTWGWPTVLALGLVWDGDRRRSRLAWGVYFAVLFLLCTVIALRDTPPLSMFGIAIPAFFQGLGFWAVSLSYSPFLLLFLNRAVRSIGPALLAMMLVAMLGGTAVMVAASTPVGMALLASVAEAMGLAAGGALLVPPLAGMVAAAPLAWWLGRRLRAAYASKWMSDQSLMIDALWGFQAVLLGFELSLAVGPGGWLGAGAFALHKAVTLAGMAPAARAARRRRPLQLLLLRVFTRRDRRGRLQSRRADAERLFDVLGSRWRTIGPIAMIGAPDLASSTIDPDEFLDFLAGRLRERFIVDPTDVPGRLAAVDDRCDLDARWRVTDLFCGNDAWRPAVLGLMTRSDLVAMDLRDFGPDNQGCIFELQAVIDLVPAARVALLVDGSTRQEFLQATIAACVARVPLTSPNAQAGVKPVIVDVALGEEAAVDQLIRMTASYS